MFRPVKVGRVSKDIVDQLQSLIFSGKFAPGDRLPAEKELTEHFHVSRISVRDALRVLESQGLIKIRVGAGGGTFVAQPNSEFVTESLTNMLRLHRTSIRDLVEARQIIETNIVALAAERATAEDIAKIQTAIDHARAGRAAADPHFTPHSVEFHVALAEAAKNQVLLFTVNSFRTLFYQVVEKLIPDPAMAERAIDDHQEILTAIQARDAARARELMRAHLAYFQARAAKIERALAESASGKNGYAARALARPARARPRSRRQVRAG